MRSYDLLGIEFQFCKMKNSGDLLYNNVNIPNITESYLTLLNHTLKNGKDGTFYVMYLLLQLIHQLIVKEPCSSCSPPYFQHQHVAGSKGLLNE